jgi:hypothetical protein
VKKLGYFCNLKNAQYVHMYVGQKLANPVTLTSFPNRWGRKLRMTDLDLGSKPSSTRFFFVAVDQGCQIFLGKIFQDGKNIPHYHKICIPNGGKIDQMTFK